jgi:ankyrin repeat protein
MKTHRHIHFPTTHFAAALLATLAGITPARCADTPAIIDAASKGKLAKVRALLKRNPQLVNATDSNGATPLHYAALYVHKDVVQLLLASGAEVNAKAHDGVTPLHYCAASRGSKDVAKLLLANGAEVNAKDQHGSTPLHYTVGGDVAEFLLGNGAEANAANDGGFTPLHWAANKGWKDVAQVLLANGAEVNAKNHDGATPLALATKSGWRDVAQLLLANGGEVNAKNHDGATPGQPVVARERTSSVPSEVVDVHSNARLGDGQSILLGPFSETGPNTFFLATKSQNQIKAEEFAVRAGGELAKGDFDGAIANYTEALRLDTGSPIYRLNRGVGRLRKKDYDGAIADCNEAIRAIAENSARAVGVLSAVVAENSSVTIQRALDMSAAFEVLAYTDRGLAKEGKEDWDGAIADLTKVYELKPAALRSSVKDEFGIATINPDVAFVYWSRGNTKLLQKDWDSAIRDYTTAIELKPDYAEAYNNRAVAKHEKGDEDGAKADLAKAIQLKPSLGQQ